MMSFCRARELDPALIGFIGASGDVPTTFHRCLGEQHDGMHLAFAVLWKEQSASCADNTRSRIYSKPKNFCGLWLQIRLRNASFAALVMFRDSVAAGTPPMLQPCGIISSSQSNNQIDFLLPLTPSARLLSSQFGPWKTPPPLTNFFTAASDAPVIAEVVERVRPG